MKLYIAVVRIDWEVECYVNLDYAALRKELADTCRSLWQVRNLPGEPSEDDEEVIDLYYSEVEDEYLLSFEKELSVNLAVGTISHRHGTNFYVGDPVPVTTSLSDMHIYQQKTFDGLYEKMAKHCRYWWHEEGLPGEPDEDDYECVNDYFDQVPDEFFEVDDLTI